MKDNNQFGKNSRKDILVERDLSIAAAIKKEIERIRRLFSKNIK